MYDVADFNSDGRLDLVTTGWKENGTVRVHNNAVLINNGDGTFTAINTDIMVYGDNPIELALNTLAATDLNNDGYADFMTQGNIDNGNASDKPVVNGKTVGRTFIAAMNLGADGVENGMPQLYDLGLADGVAHYYGHGGQLAFDYNNDGVMDIFVGGESPDDARNGGDWNYHWMLLQGKLNAEGEVSYSDVSGQQAFNNAGVRPLNDNNPIRAIDYTGNGEYDIFLPGWCEGNYVLDGEPQTQAGWFFPNEAGTYPQTIRVPGASETTVFFTENGVSGARNYAFTGYSSDSKFFENGSRKLAYTNNPYAKPARPEAPATAVATVDAENKNNVTLEWTKAASSKDNVTYDYYIKDAVTGKYYRGITAFVGGDKDGVRTTIAQGRAFMAKKLNLVGLPDGVYEWGVQTVGANLEGSKFTTGNEFTIGNAGVEAVSANAAERVVAVEYYDAAGRRVAGDATGIIIKKEILEGGAAKVSKSIVK